MQPVLDTIVPIYAVVALGWLLAGRPGLEPEPLARLAVTVAAPCLVFTLFSRVAWDSGAMPLLVLGTVLVLATTLVVGRAGLALMAEPHRGLLMPIVFWNAGNMGLSAVRLGLGEQALPAAGVVFVTVATLQAVLGTWIAKGKGGAREVLRMPLVHACLAGLLCSTTGTNLPPMLLEPVSMLGEMAIPLMLLTLGMSLRRLRVTTLQDACLAASLRMGVGFGAGLAVVALLGLSGIERQVLLIECALPPAVINVILARRYAAAPEAVASTIVVGTLASLLVLPAVLAYVL